MSQRSPNPKNMEVDLVLESIGEGGPLHMALNREMHPYMGSKIKLSFKGRFFYYLWCNGVEYPTHLSNTCNYSLNMWDHVVILF